MRKNKMMRLASMILVLTMLTTCAISGTFAKYTSQDTAHDTARVAKWGVVLQAEGDLYSANYWNNETTTEGETKDTATIDKASAGDRISVAGLQNTGDKHENFVVAPGTENTEGFHFTAEGTSEVDAMATIEVWGQNVYLKQGNYGVMVKYGTDGTMSKETFQSITGDNSRPVDAEDTQSVKLYTKNDAGVYTEAAIAGWTASTIYYTCEDYVEVADAYYYPVSYKLVYGTGGAEVYNDKYALATTTNTMEEIITEIVAEFKTSSEKLTAFNNAGNAALKVLDPDDNIVAYKATQKIEANEDLRDILKLENCVLTWQWKFERSTEGVDGNAASITDKADTILGQLMAERIDKSGDAAYQNDFDGEVVVFGTEIKAPTEYTDFCLDTQFGIDITVTQIN